MNTLWERLKMAIGQDGSIIRKESEVTPHSGFKQQYLIDLGLTKADLKKLERGGMALRQYSKNSWLPGETLPSGTEVAEGKRYAGPGHRVLWNILSELRK